MGPQVGHPGCLCATAYGRDRGRAIPQDFCANYIGQDMWLNALEWERASEWRAAPVEAYEVDGERAGTVKAEEPLTYIKLDGAGHLVRLFLASGRPMLLDLRHEDSFLRCTLCDDHDDCHPVPAQLASWRHAPGFSCQQNLAVVVALVLYRQRAANDLSGGFWAAAQVPMDQPKRALDMITRFTRREDFGGRAPLSLSTLGHPVTS